MKHLTTLMVAGGLSAFASAAVAETVSYTYTFGLEDASETQPDSLYVLDDDELGLGMTVTGDYYTLGDDNAFVSTGDADVDLNGWGLISKNGRYEEHTVDSKNGWEALSFTFDGGKDVVLTDIVISWSEAWYSDCEIYCHPTSRSDVYANYDLFADGEFVGNTSDGDVVPAGPANTFTIGARTLYEIVYGDLYDRCAFQSVTSLVYDECGYRVAIDTGFKIKSITVEHRTSEVPLPAAGWLMIAGLGGLAALRRKA